MSRLNSSTIRVGAMLAMAIAFVSLQARPAVAQSQTQPSSTNRNDSDIIISDANFAIVAQHIGELKSPTFRALLRARLSSWSTSGDIAERRQAALHVATEALADLCANQDDVRTPTAVWIYDMLAREIRSLDPDGAEAVLKKWALKKDESVTDASRDLAAAVNSLSSGTHDPAAQEKARAAIATGQISAAGLLGQFLGLQKSNPSVLPGLVSAMLTVEEQQPGFLPLQLVPFFTPFFLNKDNPTELQNRFLVVAIRRTRLPPEQLADPIIRSQVVQTLRWIAEPTKSLAPALYPEVATRLNSLGATRNDAGRAEAEARIRNSSDQLHQIEAEIEQTSDKEYKLQLLNRGARLALSTQKLKKAVDLVVAAQDEEGTNNGDWDSFLSDVARAGFKQRQPESSTYAISRMWKPLAKVSEMLGLAKYYGDNNDPEKSRSALNDAGKILKQADTDNAKLKLTIGLAQITLATNPSAAYDVFRLAVDTINQLAPPEEEKKKTYYGALMPVAEELIKSFRLMAGQDDAAALALAQDIKLSELRVSALSGVYSRQRSASAKVKND